MAANKKLTSVIAGRKINGVQESGGKLTVTFHDGSVMSVKSAGPNAPVPVGGTVAKVRQADVKLTLDMVDGSAVEIGIAEATSSVMVRDKGGAMEYAD